MRIRQVSVADRRCVGTQNIIFNLLGYDYERIMKKPLLDFAVGARSALPRVEARKIIGTFCCFSSHFI
jgi:hypothetical protein